MIKFNKINNILYDYQKEVIDIISKRNKGIIIMPTGTGKTFVQAAILAKTIIENKNKFGIYIINAPRIMLSYQLLKEVYSFLTSNKFGLNIDARYMCVHSGTGVDINDYEDIRQDSNVNFAEIKATTSTFGIKEMMETAKKENLPLILFSTYHSSTKIEDARQGIIDSINLVLNDEAHYLVSNQFYENLNKIKSKKQFFFTATSKITEADNGQGMNNINQYGEILYKMIPREAIDRGKMLRPRLHLVKTDTYITKENYQENIGGIIYNSFKQHEFQLNKKLAAKMMVTVEGAKDIINFKNSVQYKNLRNDNVNIYMVHSNIRISNMINGEYVTRLEWLSALKKDGKIKNQKIIVMHYNIISEGIDVPGLTGILLLRPLSLLNFIQTYGRIARLFLLDKLRIDSGEIKPNDLDKMVNPYGWIILPSIIAEDIDKNFYITNLVNELRTYDFDAIENILFSKNDPTGIKIFEGPNALIEIKTHMSNTSKTLGILRAEIEDEFVASLTDVGDFIDYLLK
jgi:predicted helicase